jgi:hypothetical protein
MFATPELRSIFTTEFRLYFQLDVAVVLEEEGVSMGISANG